MRNCMKIRKKKDENNVKVEIDAKQYSEELDVP